MQSAQEFGIEVNFLTGRYVATAHNNRRRTEWPPHTARLFSALVNAWAEDGQDPAERSALEWLEAQDPPAIAASGATPRRAVSHFVPVPDTSIIGLSFHKKRAEAVWSIQDQLARSLAASKGADTQDTARLRQKLRSAQDVQNQVSRAGNTNPAVAAGMFPDRRGRQERFFPSVTPDEPRVTYVWSTPPPDGLYGILDDLLLGVTNLGHSSSLVSCRMTREPATANHLPGTAGASIHSVRKGQLAALERLFALHGGIKPRSLPYVDVRYSSPGNAPGPAPAQSSMAGEWIIFEFMHGSRMFPSARAVEVARTMRSAIMSHAVGAIPEGISGHGAGGEPTRMPHAAFIPIPNVGHRRSDGRLLGIAMSVPRNLDEAARRAAFQAIGAWEAKEGGGHLEMRLKRGTVRMSRQLGSAALQSLRHGTWGGQSRQWATATPIALPRHPGGLTRGTAESRAKAWGAAGSSVADTCVHVGLPKPSVVNVSLNPFIAGAHPIARFPPFVQNGPGGEIRRQLVHALVTFESPVAGPIILGAGRFMGLGLMRPVNEETQGRAAQ